MIYDSSNGLLQGGVRASMKRIRYAINIVKKICVLVYNVHSYLFCIIYV